MKLADGKRNLIQQNIKKETEKEKFQNQARRHAIMKM